MQKSCKALEVLLMRKSATVLLAALLASAVLGASDSPVPGKPGGSSTAAAKKTPTTAQSGKSNGSKKVASKAADVGKPSRSEAGDARREELRGIWIPTDQPRDWDPLMRKLKDSGINAAFVRVAQGAKAIYPSK